jgi:hypothetical protein
VATGVDAAVPECVFIIKRQSRHLDDTLVRVFCTEQALFIGSLSSGPLACIIHDDSTFSGQIDKPTGAKQVA